MTKRTLRAMIRRRARCGRPSCLATATATLLLQCAHASSAILTMTVDDGASPLADAVVSLHSPSAAAAVRPSRAELDQSGSQFVPHVLAISLGTRVTFPNSDKVRHHVYSFSPVKRFELPLYAGSPAAPVVFDKPGLAVLGCNIHDWMVAYVLVLDTPHFGKTDAAGKVQIEAPVGDYVLRVWHETSGSDGSSLDRPISLPRAGLTERITLDVGDSGAQAVRPRRPAALVEARAP